MTYIKEIIKEQKTFFNEKDTNKLVFRMNNLKKLKTILKKNEKALLNALKKDLGKSSTEAYMTELGLVYNEIDFIYKNLSKWSKPKKVRTNLLNFKSKSYILREAYGNTLIMAPWNYPLLLVFSPLVGAIAGGNTAIIKPSEFSPHTSSLIEELINSNFPQGYIHVINGEVETSEALLEEKFDYIFFTGSSPVGKIVMEKASKNLTPITLELGGKSPCIVDSEAKLDLAAKRIIWGKFTNAGQTCVAPDYILVDKSIEKALVDKLIYYIEEMTLKDLEEYPKVINRKHFQRLESYLNNVDIIYGGKKDIDKLVFYPTLVNNPPVDSLIMNEEIFGPILPIISYENISEAIHYINSKEKPLALYVFSENRKFINKILTNISFGGGAVNDTLMHLANPHLPFGGVGQSGLGSYQGKKSFESFTHEKSILDKSTNIDINLRYPPFAGKLKWIKKLLN